MTQVICPGCAKLIEVGVLPDGTLPSCPFCRTVFQLAGPPGAGQSPATPGVAEAARKVEPRPRGGPAPDPSSAGDAATAGRKGGPGLLIMMLLGCLLAMVLLLAFSLLANREKQRAAPQDAAAAWQPVGNYSGHTHMLTPLFRIQSPVWRLAWACTANETPAKKSFQVRVLDDRGKLVGTPINSAGDQGETTQMETEPGMYFLDIHATNVEWQLTVEHQP
jgi:hypothetical protein